MKRLVPTDDGFDDSTQAKVKDEYHRHLLGIKFGIWEWSKRWSKSCKGEDKEKETWELGQTGQRTLHSSIPKLATTPKPKILDSKL